MKFECARSEMYQNDPRTEQKKSLSVDSALSLLKLSSAIDSHEKQNLLSKIPAANDGSETMNMHYENWI